MVDCRKCVYYKRWWSADTLHDWCEFADDEIPDITDGECDFYEHMDCDDSTD